MRKIIHLACALVLAMPVYSQNRPVNTGKYPIGHTSKLFLRNTSDSPVTPVYPKSSKRYDFRINTSDPYTVTYDRYGNEISLIDPSGLKNEIHEYDQTGKMLLNFYTETRSGLSEAWQKPEKYAIRTTVDSEGIRTALEHEEYSSIELNDQGLVTFFKTKKIDGIITDGTQTWDGPNLTGLTIHDDFGDSQQTIELNNIQVFYTQKEFNPYEISYYNAIAYGLYEDTPSFLAINSEGTIKAATSFGTVSAIIKFKSATEGTDQIMKGFTEGESSLSIDICNYKFLLTDANGSFVFNDDYLSENGDACSHTLTVDYDSYGNPVTELVEEKEGSALQTGEKYRYEWSYDSENKPVKVETYFSTGPDYKETLIKSEEFTEWYDPADIGSVTNPEGIILGAALYTLSGNLIKELTADEVSTYFEVPAQGIYLLNIRTDQGCQIKKIIR